MDYLYGNLPEIVDPFAYEAKSNDGTIRLEIDNDNRVISASVIKSPGKLIIKNGAAGGVVNYDGKEDTELKVPDYRLIKVQPDSGDIRSQYVLQKYNFQTNEYESVGDPLYFEEQIDELNIENGSTDEYQESSKTANGNGGITSVQYINPLQVEATYVKRVNEDTFESEYPSISKGEIGNGERLVVGQRAYSKNSGGTVTGVQSVAFGGSAYGLSDVSLVALQYQGKTYYYNIEVEKPLILSYACKQISIRCGTVDSSNRVEFIIPLEGGGIQKLDSSLYSVTWINGKVSNIVSLSQGSSVRIIRGYYRPSTAIGNQSISVGGGTQANANWSQAFGLGTQTNEQCQMVVGQFNAPEENALFIVGNGYYDVLEGREYRSNALSIMRDGTIKLYNSDSADSIITKGVFDSTIQEINEKIDNEIQSVEESIESLGSSLNDKIDEQVSSLESSISSLQGGVDSKYSQLSTTISQNVESINSKIAQVENTHSTDVQSLNTKLGQEVDSLKQSDSIINENLTKSFYWDPSLEAYVIDDGELV